MTVVADNVPGGDTPKFRNLWNHIGKKLPKKGRSGGKTLDPLSLPPELLSALDALYGHYSKTFELWEDARIGRATCFHRGLQQHGHIGTGLQICFRI